MPLRQQTKKGITVLGVGIYPDYKDMGIGALLHSEGREQYVYYVWSTEYTSDCLSVLPCPVIEVNGKLQPFSPGRMTRVQCWRILC